MHNGPAQFNSTEAKADACDQPKTWRQEPACETDPIIKTSFAFYYGFYTKNKAQLVS